MMKLYKRISTDMIATALEEYGPSARIGVPETRYSLEFHAQRNRLGPTDFEAKVVLAVDEAVKRLREQQERIKELEAWQDKVLAVLTVNAPGDVVAEYDFAWALLCREARKSYAQVKRFVEDELAERNRRAEELERFNR